MHLRPAYSWAGFLFLAVSSVPVSLTYTIHRPMASDKANFTLYYTPAELAFLRHLYAHSLTSGFGRPMPFIRWLLSRTLAGYVAEPLLPHSDTPPVSQEKPLFVQTSILDDEPKRKSKPAVISTRTDRPTRAAVRKKSKAR